MPLSFTSRCLLLSLYLSSSRSFPSLQRIVDFKYAAVSSLTSGYLIACLSCGRRLIKSSITSLRECYTVLRLRRCVMCSLSSRYINYPMITYLHPRRSFLLFYFSFCSRVTAESSLASQFADFRDSHSHRDLLSADCRCRL